MNINYQSQIELKKNLIKNSIKKTCKIDLDDLEIVKSKDLRYRNKIRLQVGKDGSLSYKKKYSKDEVKIADCLLAKEIISENLEEIQKIVKDIRENFPNSLDEITIRTNDKEILLNISIKSQEKNILHYMKEKYKDAKFAIYLMGKNKHKICGEDFLDYKIFDKKIRISSNDFYQVNDYQIENLYKIAREFLGENKKVLDLYCGSATSSIAINGDNIIGVDINKNAIKDANKNAERNRLTNYKFLAKDSKFITDKFIKKEGIDAVVVDPPRAGLDKDVVKHISSVGIKEIVYISCNPQTLGRDIKRLIDKGYQVKKIKAIDMFPQTMHVESVVLMSRK